MSGTNYPGYTECSEEEATAFVCPGCNKCVNIGNGMPTFELMEHLSHMLHADEGVLWLRMEVV